MSDTPDTPSLEKTYLPAEARYLFAGVICLVVAALLAWVAVGAGVPPWLLDVVGNALLRDRYQAFEQHFNALSFVQEAIVALFSVCFFVFGASQIVPHLGLPRLTVTKDKIALKALFGTRRASWNRLTAFEVRTLHSWRYAEADLAGPAGGGMSLFRKRFVIPDAFTTDIGVIARELNAARAAALEASPELATGEAQSTTRLIPTLAGIAFVAAIFTYFVVVHHMPPPLL